MQDNQQGHLSTFRIWLRIHALRFILIPLAKEEERPLPEIETLLLEYIQERALEEVDREMVGRGREEGEMAKKRLESKKPSVQLINGLDEVGRTIPSTPPPFTHSSI